MNWVSPLIGNQGLGLSPYVHATDIDGLGALYRESAAVLNLCGSHELQDEHAAIGCLVYVETDPVPKQVAIASGDFVHGSVQFFNR